MCTLLVLSRVANFTRPRVYQNAGPMHHCLSVEPTSTIFCTYIHWSPNPKCCLVPVKPSGPHILRLRLELNPSPVYYDVTPHSYKPYRRTHHRFSSRGRGRSRFVVEALSKKGSVVETPTLGCPR